MSNYSFATFAAVADAAQGRITELGLEVVRQEAEGLDSAKTVSAILDITRKLENIAQSSDLRERESLLGYLIETYGLLAFGTDPMLRPTLPATGSKVVRFLLGLNNKALRMNGALVGIGAVLVPLDEIVVPEPDPATPI